MEHNLFCKTVHVNNLNIGLSLNLDFYISVYVASIGIIYEHTSSVKLPKCNAKPRLRRKIRFKPIFGGLSVSLNPCL